jgi:flavin-dependent dehydrogenase
VGSGPNGLAAAVVLAQAGLAVDVFEAELTPGGAVRSMELTQPGFLHDFGSAVHPTGCWIAILLFPAPSGSRVRVGPFSRSLSASTR